MIRRATGQARGALDRLLAVSRAGEWWEYKLLPILAVFYATALRLEAPVWTLWPAALALLAALVPGAVYVSVLNDLTDRDEDEAAGKPNRMAGRPASLAAAMIAVPVAVGLGFAFAWRDSPILVLAYLGAWTAFSLYSLPPFRLKTRGLAGILADAGGAHLFPTLVAMLLVFRQAGQPVDPAWAGAVALWAGAYGLRGIVWHQLSDLDNDRAAGVRTFAHRQPPGRLAGLVRWLVFPAEAAALSALLWQSGHALPALLLLVYFALVQRRVARWNMQAVLVQPRPRYLILMVDYYDVFLPLGLIAASAIAHPLDLTVLALHLLLFPNRARQVARDAWWLRGSFRPLPAGPRR